MDPCYFNGRNGGCSDPTPRWVAGKGIFGALDLISPVLTFFGHRGVFRAKIGSYSPSLVDAHWVPGGIGCTTSQWVDWLV